MLTKQQILDQMRATLHEMFELPLEQIHEDARLYEDLDIDSLDAVDLVIELRGLLGIKAQPTNFKDVRTVGDVVAVIERLVKEQQAPGG